MRALEMIHPDDRKNLAALAGPQPESGWTLIPEVRLFGADRQWHETELRVKKNQGGSGYIVTCFDISALRRQTGQLMDSNAELERFAYSSSHDLQEPLRMITGFLGLLSKEYQDELDENAREYIRLANEGAVRMRTMISDLLGYAVLSSEKEKSSLVDLNIIVEEVQGLYKNLIEESRCGIFSDHLPSVTAKRTQMLQLFLNFIGNALKFRTAEAPQIHIGCKESKDHFEFSIRDNGIGIAPENQEQIFKAFHRLHSKSEIPGTGIGLATCKKIVEHHGGSIRLESEPGKGSVFYFTLPKT